MFKAEDSIAELVRKKVNHLGELHLDSVQTELVVNWLTNVEAFMNKQDVAFDGLARLVNDLTQTIDSSLSGDLLNRGDK